VEEAARVTRPRFETSVSSPDCLPLLLDAIKLAEQTADNRAIRKGQESRGRRGQAIIKFLSNLPITESLAR
jgi:hypothetical protein